MGQYSSRMAFLEFGIWNSEPGFLQAQPPHPARPGWRKRRLRSTLSPKGERVVNSNRCPFCRRGNRRAGGEGKKIKSTPPSPPWGRGTGGEGVRPEEARIQFPETP